MNKEQEELKKLTIVTQQDLNEGIWDAEHKGLYSMDGKRFLQYKRPQELTHGVPDTFQLKPGVEIICEKAFSGRFSPLASFVIPESVVAIGDEAFQEMKLPQYGSITITKGLKYIGHDIFGCTHGILDVVFEEGITDIDLAKVLNFPAAITVFLPSTLKSIGDGGFGGMEVSHIHLTDGNMHFCIEDGVLYDYTKTTLFRCPVTKRGVLKIPEGVTTIVANAFRLSGWQDAIDAEPEPKLNVILPKSLKKINAGAFKYTWIDSLSIPANVTEIAEGAFEYPIHLSIEVSPDNDRFEVRNNLLIDKRNRKVLLGMSNDIEIPDDIKEIGDYALTHLEAKSIVIPEGVTRLGYQNLNLNTMLQMRLPSTLQDISRESFWGWNYAELPTIIVPSGMEDYFKEKVYDGDSDIRSYIKEIPKNLNISNDGRTVLGVYDNSITSIEIPFGIEIIGESAFRDCWLLREVILPESVKQIRDCAFYGCKYLSSINLPKQLTEIDDYVFYKCEFLESIKIPRTVKRIGGLAFWECKSLRNIVFPQGLNTIEVSAFNGCSSLKKITIPSSVKELGDNAFSGCTAITTIILNEGIEKIEGQFYGCRSVKTIRIPNSLKEIDGFSLCTFEKLKDIQLSKDNPNFRVVDGALYSRDLKRLIRVMPYHKGEFIIPNGVRVIGCLAFDGCKHITKVVIPDSVKTMDRMVFQDCSSLKEVILSPKLTKIDSNCFAGRNKLSEIKIPDSVRLLDWACFRGCNAMRSIRLPDSLEIIGSAAFPLKLKSITVGPNCKNYASIDGVLYNKNITELVEFPKYSAITHFVVPETVKKISYGAFQFCERLKSIKLPEGLVEIGNGAFDHCSSLKSIRLPDGIMAIPEHAFYGCKALKTIKLPHKLKRIEEGAFAQCVSLTYLRIPPSVKSLGSYPFPKSLKELHIGYKAPNEAELFWRDLFYYLQNDEGTILYVPKGTKENFMKDEEDEILFDTITIEEEP